MSITGRHLSNKTFNPKNFYPLTILSLNEIFRESMNKINSGPDRVNLITRCENLPHIRGNKKDISDLFENLIRFITSYPAVGTKLFLYIDCEEHSNQSISREIPAEYKIYTIKFRTNISPESNWEEINKTLLEKSSKVLSMHNAIFQVNSNTNCLFCISVPGKF